MEKIKGFQISSMTVSGFKCYEAPMEITFGNPTIVTGGNGRGKSSLADAIAFAVTGLPFFGERGIDRLHNETNPDLQITMRFMDETGKAHELTRSRQKDRMSITYDGYAIRQTDLNEMFGERDVFLSIFNPLYFIEELGEDGKKLLERYLPPIPQADVLSLLNEQTQQRLSGLQLPSPETFLKNRREEIRELEQNAVYLSGKLDLAQKQRQSSKELSNGLTAQIQELQQEISLLEARRFETVNLEDLQEQLVQASEQYEELSGEAPETPDTAELDAKLQEFHAKLGARSSEIYQPKYTGPLAEDTAKVQALGKRYQQNAALLKRFQPGTSCPVCRRVLSQQEYPAFRQALQAETEKIAADGTQLKGQITELQELEQKSQSTFEQFKADDLVRYQSEIDALNRKREQLQAAAAQQNMQRQQTLEQLRRRIQNLTASMECGTLSPADSERLAECKASLEDCRVQLAAAQQVLCAALEDFDTRIKAIEEEITEKKIVMKDVILYMSKRAELTFSKLALNRVKISLYDVVKTTGELKDVFRFTYNGRRYDRLSLSEKIRAGAEVSELVKRLTGRNYPVFFDNMESVDDLSNIRPTSQMILAKCVRNAELSVQGGQHPLCRRRRDAAFAERRRAIWLIRSCRSWKLPDGAGLPSTTERFTVKKLRQAAPSAAITGMANII